MRPVGLTARCPSAIRFSNDRPRLDLVRNGVTLMEGTFSYVQLQCDPCATPVRPFHSGFSFGSEIGSGMGPVE